MYLNGNMLLSTHAAFWVAQLGDSGIDTPEEAASLISGPHFFIAVISGILLALGFHLLLTNLSVATGISYLTSRSGSKNGSSGGSLGGTIRTVSTAAGVWTLITTSLALFFACWLAVTLSIADTPMIGVVLGLVIWAAYFSLLFWFSSTAVGSAIGSIVSTATSSFRALFNTATAAIGARTASSEIVRTVEASAEALRREIAGSIDPEGLREKLEDYLSNLRSPGLDAQNLQMEFERMLRESDVLTKADPDALRNLDRQVFVELVSSRTDLSKREVERVAAQLESTWKRALGQAGRQDRLGELVDYLKSAQPNQLVSQELGQRLDTLIEELRTRRQDRQDQQQQSAGILSQGLSNAFNALIGIVLGRTDLSDFDVEKVLGQLKSAQSQLTDQAGKLATKVSGSAPEEPYGVIRADVENYLLNAYSWQLTPAKVRQDFREVLYDPNGDAGEIRRQLERLSRSDFAEILQSRGLFTQEEIRRLADELESIRIEALRDAKAVEVIEKSKALRRQVTTYLQLRPKPMLESNSLENDLRSMLSDPEADIADLRTRFAQFDRATLVEVLTSRPDITPEEATAIATRIEQTINLVLADAEGLQSAAKARVDTQWQKVADHLRHTGRSELNPEGIQRDLRTLLDDPQAGIHDLRLRMAQFDRNTLVQLLSQRPDMSEAEANRILDQVEANWYQVRYAPQHLAATVSGQYDKATSAITDYLRNTGKEELNPEAIRRDLQLLLDDPKAGAGALRDRLARMDRDTLVKLLSQRQDLSEEDVNRIIDQVQESIREIVRSPRRLAVRTQTRVQDFQTAFADYLRNTGKDELNPEGIQRDLQLLLQDPRLGAQSLRDRLAHVDRSTMVALLAQRNDMTEEEANQIVERVLSVRDRITDQLRAVQYQIQSFIDSILTRIRDYLNSLERPELNYEGVRDDIRLLFEDPQAGSDALRHRLAQFDRNTLVAILSSNENISETDVNRIIDRIERTRDSAIRRAEWLQSEVQRRLEDMRHETEKQIEAVQQAAVAASWWLFFTALVSGIAAAVGGSIGVAG